MLKKLFQFSRNISSSFYLCNLWTALRATETHRAQRNRSRTSGLSVLKQRSDSAHDSNRRYARGICTFCARDDDRLTGLQLLKRKNGKLIKHLLQITTGLCRSPGIRICLAGRKKRHHFRRETSHRRVFTKDDRDRLLTLKILDLYLFLLSIDLCDRTTDCLK